MHYQVNNSYAIQEGIGLGYKIIYDHQSKYGYHKKQCHPKRYKYLVAVVMIIILIITQIQPVRTSIKQFLLPEGWTDTEAAFDSMIHQVKNGESLYEATAAFCQEIINAGKQN